MGKYIRLTAYAIPGENGAWVIRYCQRLFLAKAFLGDDARMRIAARALGSKGDHDRWLSSLAIPAYRIRDYARRLPRSTRDEIKQAVTQAARDLEPKAPPKQYVMR